MHRKVAHRRVARRSIRCRSSLRFGFVAGGAMLLLSSTAGVAAANPVNWDAVAQCESGGNWSANTGNGFYGGLQFKPSTWQEYGGVGSPAAASREEQITVANRVLAAQGPEAWPRCGADLDEPTTGSQPRLPNIFSIVWSLVPH